MRNKIINALNPSFSLQEWIVVDAHMQPPTYAHISYNVFLNINTREFRVVKLFTMWNIAIQTSK